MGWVVSSILALPVEPALVLCETAAPVSLASTSPARRRVRRVKKRACGLVGRRGRRPPLSTLLPPGTNPRDARLHLRLPERCPGRATG